LVRHVLSSADGPDQDLQFLPTSDSAGYYFKQIINGNDFYWAYNENGMQKATVDSSDASQWTGGYRFEEDTTST
jgi:hypothetical protein